MTHAPSLLCSRLLIALSLPLLCLALQPAPGRVRTRRLHDPLGVALGGIAMPPAVGEALHHLARATRSAGGRAGQGNRESRAQCRRGSAHARAPPHPGAQAHFSLLPTAAQLHHWPLTFTLCYCNAAVLLQCCAVINHVLLASCSATRRLWCSLPPAACRLPPPASCCCCCSCCCARPRLATVLALVYSAW